MALIPPFGILVTFKDRRASNPYREYPREILNAPESHTVYMVETDLSAHLGGENRGDGPTRP